MNIALLAGFILLLLLFGYVVYCSIVGQRPLSPWQPLKRRQVAVSPAHPTSEPLIKIEISKFYSLQWQLGELANLAWTTAQSFQLEPFELSFFLAGYKRETAQHESRPGHRLGYLTDAEYKEAQRYVRQLRQSHELS